MVSIASFSLSIFLVPQGKVLLTSVDNLQLTAYSDFDWASYMSRRLVTGYIVLLDKSPIGWKSKKQSTVAKSSVEAERRAMAHVAAEITWLVSLLRDCSFERLQRAAGS